METKMSTNGNMFSVPLTKTKIYAETKKLKMKMQKTKLEQKWKHMSSVHQQLPVVM